MAFQSGPVLDFSYQAAEDLSNYQYHFVKINTDGKVRLLDSAVEIPDGVLQNAPASGAEASVRHLGISKVVANASLDEGTAIKPEYVGATDAGKAADGTYGGVIVGVVVGASAAEDDLASVYLLPQTKSELQTTVSTLTTAGNLTLTAAQILGGLILRDPAGGARTDTTATAVLLIAEMAKYGLSDFEFTIRNTAVASETITIAGGVDVTISGTATIAQNNTKRFKAVKTSATEVTIYSLGTVVH